MANNKPLSKLTNFSIIFATFSPWENNQRLPTNGMIEPMLSFFVPKVKRFVLIDEPHPGSDRLLPVVEIYENGQMIKKSNSSFLVSWLYPFLKSRNTVGTHIPFKIRDFLSSVDFVFADRKRYDLFIGLESINALAGIFLKKLGLVKKVIYYVSDYSPSRYRSGWFNQVYLTLDRLAATHADFIWDVSLAMMPARAETGLDVSKAAPCIHVPNALFPSQINYLPLSKIDPYSLVFAGTLGVENGPDLAIEATAIVAKKLPQVKLHIYGGGNSDLQRLQELTNKLKLQNRVIFHGFLADQIKLSEEIRHYGLGLAPYKAIPGSPRWWADATKIRLYLAAGLPAVTTQVPPLGKELEEAKAGLVAQDKPEEFAQAIIKLLSDKTVYEKARLQAIKKAEDNTWENTYSQALKKMSS